jgi:TonB family protein
VVVNENLDGKDDEPPPLEESKVEPPKPPPKPEVEAPPPKLEKAVDAVEIVKEKPKKKPKAPEKKKPPEKKEKKPEPPKKSREELMRERMERMRKSATTVKTPIVVDNAPSGNGRTEKKTLSVAEIRKLLGQAYRPGKREQLASSERQRCLSLVQMALDSKWREISPPVEQGGMVHLSVNFDRAGRMVNCRIVKSCGNAVSDRAALTVASRVGYIAGLSQEFISEFSRSPLTIRYKVEAR